MPAIFQNRVVFRDRRRRRRLHAAEMSNSLHPKHHRTTSIKSVDPYKQVSWASNGFDVWVNTHVFCLRCTRVRSLIYQTSN